MKILIRFLLILFICFIGGQNSYAQEDRREKLEEKRNLLKKEIQQINGLLASNKKEKQSVLTQAEDLERKIQATANLIRINNQEANLLTQEISANENRIGVLRKELEALKEDYAAMVQKSYKSQSKQSRLMFLFSSDNFLQAYKRLQYMKQYADYRVKQGEKIKSQAAELQELNEKLIDQKKEKEKLLAENQATQKALQKDKQEQKKLIAAINKKGSNYQKQINERQQQINEIDKEIQRLIREAIAAENKKKGSSSKSAFELTPEAKALAANFEANKGKLPWPLKTGNVAMAFGEHPSPIAKNVTVKSNGIRIETNEREPVQAIFDGTVINVQAIKGANRTVLIQHGNYISVYRNLVQINVKKGQKVSTGDNLGRVGKSRDTNRPTLNFYIFKDSHYINPMHWILRR